MIETETQTRRECRCLRAGPLMTDFLRRLWPSETVVRHFRAASLEMLMGFRAMLDEQITARSEAPPQGKKITVE